MDATVITLLTESVPAFFAEGRPTEPLQAASIPRVQRLALEGQLTPAQRARPRRAAAEPAGYGVGATGDDALDAIGGGAGLAVAFFAAFAVYAIAQGNS